MNLVKRLKNKDEEYYGIFNFDYENKVKVNKYVSEKGSKIVKFVRYEVGEGMQKREENFAEEVSKQMNG